MTDSKFQTFRINVTKAKGPEVRHLHVPRKYHLAIKEILGPLLWGNPTDKEIKAAVKKLKLKLIEINLK